MVGDGKLSPEACLLRDIDRLRQTISGVRVQELRLIDLLEREAETLVAAHRNAHPGAAYMIRGDKYRPGQSRATDAEILAAPLTRGRGARLHGALALVFGLSEVRPHVAEIVDPRFEAACDAIVVGDAPTLRSLLARDPSLVHARSRFAHHQTLLQHVAANGIEHNRQWQSPRNAVEIAEILLAAGAGPDVTCDSYGGGSTAMTLLVSSAHPAAAGVQGDLVEALCRGGAKPDGPNDDGMPLWSAIVGWYPRAADALVRCGARVDNLLFAAAVGDLRAVEGYFDASGRLVPDRAYGWGRALALARPRPPEHALDPRHMLEYALHWAAAHRRRSVVEFLLTKNPDPRIREPIWNNTALDCARYGGDVDVIALIKPLFDENGQPLTGASP